MIAYNQHWLQNLKIRSETDKAHETKCIAAAEKEKIYETYPVTFYSPNIFVRLGLFILTLVIAIFSLGLLSLMFMDSVERSIGGLLLFLGLACYAGLEVMVSKNHYKSGVDDALCWAAAVCIYFGLYAVFKPGPQAASVIVFLLSLLLFLRFTDSMMAGICSLALLSLLFFSLKPLGHFAKSIAPFVLMLASLGLYLFAKYQLKKKQWSHYTEGLTVILITALFCGYLAGNYYVVREISNELYGLDLQPEQGIPLGWLFWMITILLPLIYLARGIQKKDIVLIRSGLLLIGGMVFTVRTYYHILPVELAMAGGGVIIIILSYALLRYLNTTKHGFTAKLQNDKYLLDHLHLESLVLAQSFGAPHSAPESGIQFGGGTGEGGGATGGF